MSTKAENILDPNSCWNKAANNEVIFVLRANDPIAPDVVVMWANMYVQSKGGWGRMTPTQQAKFRNALDVANRMRGSAFDDDIPF